MKTSTKRGNADEVAAPLEDSFVAVLDRYARKRTAAVYDHVNKEVGAMLELEILANVTYSMLDQLQVGDKSSAAIQLSHLFDDQGKLTTLGAKYVEDAVNKIVGLPTGTWTSRVILIGYLSRVFDSEMFAYFQCIRAERVWGLIEGE